MTAHAFCDADRLVLTLQFWREEHLFKHSKDAGEVFVAEIPRVEFVGILEDLVAVLDGGPDRECP